MGRGGFGSGEFSEQAKSSYACVLLARHSWHIHTHTHKERERESERERGGRGAGERDKHYRTHIRRH